MTQIAPEPRAPFDFPPVTNKVSYLGVDYNFRELTVSEIDQAREDSMIDEKFDGRLMTRLMITMGSTEPKIDLEQLAKLPQRLYSAIVDCVNDLNDPEALAEADKDPGEILTVEDVERFEIARLFSTDPNNLRHIPLSEYRKRRAYWLVSKGIQERTEKGPGGVVVEHTGVEIEANATIIE